MIGSLPRGGNELAAAGVRRLVLCASEYQPPVESFPGVQVVDRFPFKDDFDHGLPEDRVPGAFRLAESLAQDSGPGYVLVTCRAGRNRSGLILALALIEQLRMEPQPVIDLIQAKRVGALSNPKFRELLLQVRAK